MGSSRTTFIDDGAWASWFRHRAERQRSIVSTAVAVAAHLAAIGIPFWLHETESSPTSRRASTRSELDMTYPTESGRDDGAVEHLVSIATIAGGAERPLMVNDGVAAAVAKPLASTRALSTERRARSSKLASQQRGSGTGSGKGASSGDIFGGLFDYTGPMTLRAEFCTLPRTTFSIANLGECNDLGTMRVKRINVPVRHYFQGFPGAGLRNEFVGVRYTGSFVVKRSGLHQFRLLSDDGSQLFIDGRLIIDNDGLHSVTDVTNGIELEAGQHDIMVRYFQGPGEEIALQLFVAAPYLPERLFTTHVW